MPTEADTEVTLSRGKERRPSPANLRKLRERGSEALCMAVRRKRPCLHPELTRASSRQTRRFKFCCGSPSLWPFVSAALEPNTGGSQERREGGRVQRNSSCISFRAHGVSAYLSVSNPFKHPTPCTVLSTSHPAPC